MRKTDTKKITSTAIFLSLAIMLSIVENALPPLVPFLPQAKIGIANIVILTSMLLLGNKQAYVIVIMRALINSIYQGNPVAFIYSFIAGTVSFIVMVLLIRSKVFSLIAVSAISAMTHNLMQVCVAAVMLSGTAVFAYLPYLIVVGGLAGGLTGLISYFVILKYPLNTLSSFYDENNDKESNES